MSKLCLLVVAARLKISFDLYTTMDVVLLISGSNQITDKI